MHTIFESLCEPYILAFHKWVRHFNRKGQRRICRRNDDRRNGGQFDNSRPRRRFPGKHLPSAVPLIESLIALKATPLFQGLRLTQDADRRSVE